ncbi:MAG: 4-(cytidine 5'-diphospho)-2-C-methyl-D-erythritol kinase [Chloroflexota bacterium]
MLKLTQREKAHLPSIAANAKINLGLEILGRRPDGFHEVRTLLARVELHDTLTLRSSAEVGVRWPAGVLAPPNDLVRRAATLLRAETGVSQGARITLQKAIPMAGGLGGGSADAAATLFALNVLWGTGLSTAELARLGASLGADVPFFFAHGPSIASGRGDDLVEIGDLPPSWIVLVAPEWEIQAKTAALYAALTPDDFTDGAQIQAIAQCVRGTTPLSQELTNAFERVIDRVFPSWSAMRAQLENQTGRRFWLTGAGPCVYTLLPSEEAANAVATAIQPLRLPIFTTRLVNGALRLIDDS